MCPPWFKYESRPSESATLSLALRKVLRRVDPLAQTRQVSMGLGVLVFGLAGYSGKHVQNSQEPFATLYKPCVLPRSGFRVKSARLSE